MLFNEGKCAIACASFDECSDKTVLTDVEKKYYDGFGSEKRKAEYLAGRFLAKKVLSQLVAITEVASILKSTDGKPYFDEPYGNFSISITHSRGIIVVIVFPSTMNYGIDLEYFDSNRITTMKYGLKKNFFDIEQQDVEEITTLWSLKEAVYKTGVREGFSVRQKSNDINALYEELGKNSIDFTNIIRPLHFSSRTLIPYGIAFSFSSSEWVFTIVKLSKISSI